MHAAVPAASIRAAASGTHRRRRCGRHAATTATGERRKSKQGAKHASSSSTPASAIVIVALTPFRVFPILLLVAAMRFDTPPVRATEGGRRCRRTRCSRSGKRVQGTVD